MVCMQCRPVLTELVQLAQCSFDAGDAQGKQWGACNITYDAKVLHSWPIRMQRNVCANGLHSAAEDTFPEVIYSGGGASLVFCRAGRAAQMNCSHLEYS